MIMEDGVVVNEPGGISDRQVALIAATIIHCGGYGHGGGVFDTAERYLRWLRKED